MLEFNNYAPFLLSEEWARKFMPALSEILKLIAAASSNVKPVET